MQNVFNAVVTGGGGPWDEEDIVDDAVDWCDTMFANLTANMVNVVDGSQVQVYEYDAVDDDWDEVGSDLWTFNPTGTSDQLARGVAALINAKSLDPDISGKKYLGGLNEAMLTNGLWESAAVTAFANFAADWITSFTGSTSGADWAPGIWSVAETVFKLMSGTYIIPTIPAYQRRRKRGVGV